MSIENPRQGASRDASAQYYVVHSPDGVYSVIHDRTAPEGDTYVFGPASFAHCNSWVNSHDQPSPFDPHLNRCYVALLPEGYYTVDHGANAPKGAMYVFGPASFAVCTEWVNSHARPHVLDEREQEGLSGDAD